MISTSVLNISREQAQKWDISAADLEGRNTLIRVSNNELQYEQT